MMFRRADLGEALSTLLAEQRRALRSGDFEALTRILPKLERLVARLEVLVGPADEPEAEKTARLARLAALKSDAAQNARLLRAARAGLEKARPVDSAKDAPRLATYDQRGRISDTNTPSASVLARR